MCFSFFMSILTGTLATSSALYCIFRNATYRDKWNGYWVLFLALMQWYDAGLWYLHDNIEDLSVPEPNENGLLASCSSQTNHIITKAAFATIMLEPLGSLFSYMYAARKRVSIKLLLIYIFIFLILTYFSRDLIAVWYDPSCASSIENNACSVVTDKGHLLYSIGRDSNGTFKCWNKYYFFGELQEEIPLILRFLFLIGIIYPYTKSNPYMPGMINSIIIIISWILGYFTDAHASVWCWGASLQSIYIFIDPYLFPYGSTPGSKQTKFQYYSNGTKEFRIQKKQYLKLLQCKYNSKTVNIKDKNYYDAIVIGSGIGGLSTAALLSQSGKKVLVLEQHYRAGGCMHTFDEFGGEFDSGIHYVGAVNRLKIMLSFITSKVVEWYPMGSKNDKIYDKFDLDGEDNHNDNVYYRPGMDSIKKELQNKFPEDSNGLDQYFKFIDKYSGRIGKYYLLSKLFPNWSIWGDNKNSTTSWIYEKYIEPYMKYSRMTANQVISKFVSNPKLRAILSGGQLIDWCLIPKHCSWWVCSAMMNYYIDGGFYPKGGSNNIPLSIIPVIRQNGGNVVCQAKVKKILINENNEAYGVEMDKFGEKIYSKMIISGVGAHTLFYELLGNNNNNNDEDKSIKETVEFEQEMKGPSAGMTDNNIVRKTIMNKKDELNMMENVDECELNGLVPSYGHMTAFITLDGTSEELDLPDYNIHSWNEMNKYNYDISKIQELFYSNPFKYGNDALICLTFPSAKDPYYNKKFPNKSNALLLTEAKWEWFEIFGSINGDNKYGKRQDEYNQFKNKFKDMFLQRLYKYCPKTKGKVENIEIGSPLSSLHFLNTYKGGSYGLSWNTTRFNHKYTKKFFHAKAADIKNLYMTGESTLFGGLLGALLSGYVTAVKILGLKQIIKIVLCTRRVEE